MVIDSKCDVTEKGCEVYRDSWFRFSILFLCSKVEFCLRSINKFDVTSLPRICEAYIFVLSVFSCINGLIRVEFHSSGVRSEG